MRKKYYSLLKRAKEKNLEVNINYEDYRKIKLSDCVYCGVSELFLKFYCDLMGVNTPYMTIDRKDNNLGYIKENCVSACFLCNKIKGNFFSFDEMVSIGKNYVHPKLKKFEQEAHENFAEWCDMNVVLDDEENDYLF